MYLELSYVLDKDLPNYLESQKESLEPLLRQKNGNVSNTSMIHHFTHNGTHLDTPFHFDSEGKKIQELPIEDFIYENPVLLNIPKKYSDDITLDDLMNFNIDDADALLIRTGFDEIRTEDPIGYRVMFPGLTVEAAKYIREELVNVKAIFIDFLSVDKYLEGNRNNFPVHHQLLCKSTSNKKPVLIIEDVNLKPLLGKEIEKVFALPMRFKGADGAPVNIVASVK